MRRALVLAAVLAAPIAAAKSDPLAGRLAGPPSECVNLSSLEGPQIVDDHTILYRQSGRRIWRTGPVGPCPSLRPFGVLIVDVYGGQLCRNDRFRVKDPNLSIPSGYCRFSAFVPYDKP